MYLLEWLKRKTIKAKHSESRSTWEGPTLWWECGGVATSGDHLAAPTTAECSACPREKHTHNHHTIHESTLNTTPSTHNWTAYLSKLPVEPAIRSEPRVCSLSSIQAPFILKDNHYLDFRGVFALLWTLWKLSSPLCLDFLHLPSHWYRKIIPLH